MELLTVHMYLPKKQLWKLEQYVYLPIKYGLAKILPLSDVKRHCPLTKPELHLLAFIRDPQCDPDCYTPLTLGRNMLKSQK